MNWSEVVKDYRVKNGLLQKQVAYDFGVDVMTVSRWERGISEPSKLQKGRIKDLVTRKKDPLFHRHIQQLAAVCNTLSVIDLVKEEYVFCGDMPGMSMFDPKEVIGQHPEKFFRNEISFTVYDAVGGYSGLLANGLMAARCPVRIEVGGEEIGIEYVVSVLRIEDYNPVMIHMRRRTDAPPAQSVADIAMTYEDDLPGV